MTKALCGTIAAVVVAALCPERAFAQAEPRPPVGAVFGSSAGASSAGRDKLTLTVDANESYDQNVAIRTGDTTLSLFQTNGFYTVFTPSLEFSSSGDRLQTALTAASNVRYYNDLHETVVTNHSVGAGLTFRLSPRTAVSFNQGFTYAPALFYGLFATANTPTLGEVVPPASNYALNTERSYASATSAGLTRQLSSRATLSFASNVKYTKFMGGNSASYPDVNTRDVGGRLTYSLNRDLGLRLGYLFRQAQYAGSPQSTEHDLDIGIEYKRPLSRTRKTAVAFTIGPTAATAPLITGASEVRRQYRLIGDASLAHQMGRTWSLQGSYHRGLGYIEGLQTPVFTGAYSAAAGGYLNRRTDLSFSAAYSTGESALTGSPSQFTTYTGTGRVRYAMGRMWAAYVDYVFYYYEFNRSLPLPVGVPSGLTRNGLRMGVMLWIPVKQR
jgi:hypothetical protein